MAPTLVVFIVPVLVLVKRVHIIFIVITPDLKGKVVLVSKLELPKVFEVGSSSHLVLITKSKSYILSRHAKHLHD